MGIVLKGHQQSDRRPEPCPFQPLARIGSYSRYHRAFTPNKHFSSFPSPPSPPVFRAPCNFSDRQFSSASQIVGCLLKSRELPSASSLTCVCWPLRRGPNVAYAINGGPLVRAAHTSSASFPDFSQDSNMEPPTMHLGAGLGALSTEHR
jgi:hypothetical protein